MNNPLIQLKDISLSRNDKSIIRDMSLNVNSSSVLNIYGHNGSGKTTLLKILAGITEPTSGEIINNINQYGAFAYIGHKHGIKNNLTLNENLLYGDSEKFYDQNRIDEVIDTYNMSKYKNYLAKNLSHGQQKKISLMKANISSSPIWVIDEPYSALDKDSVSIVDQSICDHIKNEGAVIMSNHELITNKPFNIDNIEIN
jgi:heme exporter protein A